MEGNSIFSGYRCDTLISIVQRFEGREHGFDGGRDVQDLLFLDGDFSGACYVRFAGGRESFFIPDGGF